MKSGTDGRGVRTPPRASEAGLSRLQRHILRLLHEWALQIRDSGDIRAQVILDFWGVPWRPGAHHSHWTASRRAAYSRALRRLEQRGLVLRVSRGRTRTSGRTTHVWIIPRRNT
jgi:hypothetical protein